MVGVMATSVAIYMWLPRSYASDGQLFVQLGRANSSMDPSPEESRSVSIQDSRETEILSVVELLKGNGILTEVVKEIGPERILENEIKLPLLDTILGMLNRGDGTVDPELPEEYATLKLRERAVKKLAADLEIAAQKKTSVISVYCEAASPRLAQEIVDTVMSAVQKLHVSVHAVEKSKTFFESEFEIQEGKVRAAEQALRDFRNENSFLSVDEARATLNGVIAKLENEAVDVRVDLTESLTTIQGLQAQAAGISEKIEMPMIGIESSSTESAQTQLNLRKAERARLLTTFTEADPRVVGIDQEIDLLQKSVSSMPKERKQSAFASNPVFENLRISILQETARSQALQARMEKIASEQKLAADSLLSLNDLKMQEEQLQRDARVNAQYLETYVKKRGEANVIDRLDKQRFMSWLHRPVV
jgi:polysaccharide biosynthesis protein PslE